LDEDTRLVPILNNLSQGFLAGIASEWASAFGPETGDDIKAEMVNGLAAKHFPMCMRALHDNLQRDSHLKYFGRLQYGLFLKVRSTDIGRKLIANVRLAGVRTVNRRSYCLLAKILL
jgi:DNA primase large subunit